MSGNMDMFGDLGTAGRVLTPHELVERRHRNGQCPTCGQRCFEKRLFKMKPISVPGRVLNGRCLECDPQDPTRETMEASCEPIAAAGSTAPPRQRTRARPKRGGLAASVTRTTQMFAFRHSKAAASTGQIAEDEDENGDGDRDDNDDGGRQASATLPPSRPPAVARGVPVKTSELRPAQLRKNSRPLSSSTPLSVNGSGSIGIYDSDSDSDDEDEDELLDLRDRRQLMEKSASSKFLLRETPRPSTIILGDDDVDALFREDYDSLSDEGDGDDGGGDARGDDDGGDHDGPPPRSASRLTGTERRALRALNSTENSFLDVVNIMLENSSSVTVSNEGLHALSLVHDPEAGLLEECAERFGFEVIVSAMEKCGKDAMAQTNACKVLFIASASGENLQIDIGNAGGIEALSSAMKEFDDDVIVLEGCLLALSNLCIPEDNVGYALEGELIELAVEAMSRNVENCGLQEHGCAVLANLAVHGEARRRIRGCGGCDTVVVSMVVSPMDVGVQSQALVTLRNLCVGDAGCKVLLANAGAIDVVLQAMRNHGDDGTIQARGSWVLGLIGTNEDNKLYIGQNGGADAVVQSMWVHADDMSVQEKGCRALWTMSVHPRNRHVIAEADAIPAIVAAMQNHAAEPNIQERGCGVLCNLAANDDELKVQIVNDGALDVTVMAMVLHGENEMIQERAVALLHKLCIPENIEWMVNANVSPMMAVVAEIFPDCREKATFVLTQLQ